MPRWVRAKEQEFAAKAGYQPLHLSAEDLAETSFQNPSVLQAFLEQQLPESAIRGCLLSASGRGISLLQTIHQNRLLRPAAESVFWGNHLPDKTPDCALPVYAAHAAAPNLCFCFSAPDGLPGFYAWQNYQLMMERNIPARLVCFSPAQSSRESQVLWNRYLAEVFLWMKKYEEVRRDNETENI